MKQLLQYFREVVQELKKVSWPGRRETLGLTVLVVSITTLAALYIAGLDILFQKMMAVILRK
jgi:preprotein translocase subunit SecE